jgi:hypothetical protein
VIGECDVQDEALARAKAEALRLLRPMARRLQNSAERSIMDERRDATYLNEGVLVQAREALRFQRNSEATDRHPPLLKTMKTLDREGLAVNDPADATDSRFATIAGPFSNEEEAHEWTSHRRSQLK